MKQNYTIPRHLLDGLEAFVRVAERRNFRAAAEDLGISGSALSQKVRTLESRVGVPLFTRTTRKVGLTEAGQRFLDRAAPAFAELVAAYDEARNLGRPAGLLRLHIPRAVVLLLVLPILDDFCAAYPDIEIEIFTQEYPADLIEAGFDAGVAHRELIAADMVSLRLSPPFRYVVVGTPGYFAKHGRPTRPSDLRHHNCIRTRVGKDTVLHWQFVEGGRPVDLAIKGQLIVNDISLNLRATMRGIGLGYLPDRLIAERVAAGELEVVLADFAPTTSGAFLYYPSRFQVLPKLRAFIDHIQAYGPAGPGADERRSDLAL